MRCSLILLLQLLLEVIHIDLTFSQIPAILAMDQSAFCTPGTVNMHWVEDHAPLVIIGKNTPMDSDKSVPNCKLGFGPSSQKGHWCLKVNFNSFYINECDVILTFEQSPSTTFDRDVKKLASLTCNEKPPDALFVKEKNFLLVSLDREDKYIRNYNFRINISLSEGPVESGPSATVVVITGIAALLLICLLIFLMAKYLVRMKAVWREKRAERAIEHAMRLCNSQDLHQEPVELSTSHRNGVASSASQNSGMRVLYRHSGHHSSEANSFNEDYELLGPWPRQGQPTRETSGRTTEHQATEQTGDTAQDHTEDDSEPEEMPPSYEEALEMPMPAASDQVEPIYANT